MPSRRLFFQLAAFTAAAFSFPRAMFAARSGGDVFAPANLGAYAHGHLSQASFEKQLGTPFTARLDHGSARLTLLTVADALEKKTPSPDSQQRRKILPSGGMPTTRKLSSFNISFDTNGVVMEQGSYILDHGVLGRFTVFLVPGKSPDGSTSCSACFCSL